MTLTRLALPASTVAIIALSGCANPEHDSLSLEQRNELRRRALLTLTSAATNDSPAVRIRAVEALQTVAPREGLPYFRELLTDEYAGVRFAALMAIGTLRNVECLAQVRSAAVDPDGSVRVAALFALHRLGDDRRTSELASLLLNGPTPGVRANAALVLGRMGDPGAIKVLEHALKDRDESVRLQALEAMLQLGSDHARKDLKAFALGGAGQRTVFALLALIQVRRPEMAEIFEYHLERGAYEESRLAAAVGLGRLGRDDGLAYATERMRNGAPHSPMGADSPQLQSARLKMLAALALEAIGDPASLSVLEPAVSKEEDMSVRVAAARAVLAILQREPVPLRAAGTSPA